MSVATATLRLLSAIVLGGVIGWEREVNSRAAGLRTHMLISLASATFAIVAMELTSFEGDPDMAMRIDPRRPGGQGLTRRPRCPVEPPDRHRRGAGGRDAHPRAAQPEPGLLEHPSGGGVVGKDLGAERADAGPAQPGREACDDLRAESATGDHGIE